MLLGSGPETLGRHVFWRTTASYPIEVARMDLGQVIAPWGKEGENAESEAVSLPGLSRGA